MGPERRGKYEDEFARWRVTITRFWSVERTIDARGPEVQPIASWRCSHHPDRNGGSEESMARFKEISEAYTVLSDPIRSGPPMTGSAMQGVNGGGGGNPFGQGQQGFSRRQRHLQPGVRDAFGDVFGGRQRQGSEQGGPRRGSDLRYDLEITLEQAYKGEPRSRFRTCPRHPDL